MLAGRTVDGGAESRERRRYQKKLRRTWKDRNRRNAYNITIRIAKRIGTIIRRKETVYKDILIHVLIKTVEGQDVESIITDWITTAAHRVYENTPTITC